MRNLPLMFLALSAAGCTFSPGVSTEEAAVLKAAAQPLLAAKIDTAIDFPDSQWPTQFQEILDPLSVHLEGDGLYVTTSESFVESKGLFFPRDPELVPVQGSEPSFTRVIPGVYKFHFKG